MSAARRVLCCDEDSLPSVSEGGVNESVSVCGGNACAELTVENNTLIRVPCDKFGPQANSPDLPGLL